MEEDVSSMMSLYCCLKSVLSIIRILKKSINTGFHMKVPNYVYLGDFSHDMKEGYGILTFSNGYCYRGEFHHDRPQGKGYFEMDGK